MGAFLEQYGVAIFVLVIIALLIALASPLGGTIKNSIMEEINSLTSRTEVNMTTGTVTYE